MGFKILVCVKQVIDSIESLTVDEGTGEPALSPGTAYRMNRFDEFALEEALLIKERLTEVTVDALSVGPERVSANLHRALGMGADHAIHIICRSEGYIGPFSVASLIAACAAPRNYDLIMAGAMSEDTMACQTGQLVAAILDLPCATSVIKEEVRFEEGEIFAEREIEGGCRERVIVKLPALLSIQPGINSPRYPSFSKVMRARTYRQEVIPAEDLVTPGPREIRRSIRIPVSAAQGVHLEGTPREKARQLVSILHEKSIL
ncbi:MAG: electron transfer flavoprotein subunit beta/FixA family protein [Desulfobacteraceae bacterium]|nr:MAG: electron transfer flavoprotein subunit beta/FixA family protein [Desulfobacteraceae bacterium]